MNAYYAVSLPQTIPKVPVPVPQPSKPKKIRKLFSAEEDQLLSRIMFEQPFTTWIAVAAQIPGRSARQCRDRWANYLSPENKNGPWLPEEDKLLTEKYREMGPQWTMIAKFFDGRSENNVKNRWYTHLRNKYAPKPKTMDKKPVSKTTPPQHFYNYNMNLQQFANPQQNQNLQISQFVQQKVKDESKQKIVLPPISTLESEINIKRGVNTPIPYSFSMNKTKSASVQPSYRRV